MDWSNKSVDTLYSTLLNIQSLRGSVATSALDRGAANIQKGNYEAALVSFKQAVAYKPDLTEAQMYVARTYGLLGRTDEAIAAYQRALRLDPTSVDLRKEFADFAMKNERYAVAETIFINMIKANPTSPGAVASLGYVYMNTGRLADAEMQFAKAVRIVPNDAAAHYSLGLVYNKQERYEEAAAQFTKALDLRRDYAVARADLAHSYLAMGDKDLALAQVAALYDLNTEEGNVLAEEIEKAMFKPKILYDDIVRGTFPARYGPGTPLETLDASLAEPGASMTFQMVFQFNTDMDISSIQRTSNWWISRADGGRGGFYNNGMNFHPGDEVSISPLPMSVRYDPLTRRATVSFTVTQNADGTGVMDPSHWVFQFHGVDAEGNTMDPDGDEYDRYAMHSF